MDAQICYLIGPSNNFGVQFDNFNESFAQKPFIYFFNFSGQYSGLNVIFFDNQKYCCFGAVHWQLTQQNGILQSRL